MGLHALGYVLDGSMELGRLGFGFRVEVSGFRVHGLGFALPQAKGALERALSS